MIVLLMGAPGAGKGTQAGVIANALEIPQISTGDIFRKNIADKTELGNKALSFINKGELVPDDVTIEIVRERILQKDCKNGFILDGFPRTVAQAEELDRMLNKMGLEVDIVLNLEVRDDVIVKRLGGRRVCPACGKIYHITSLPTKIEGICDKCGIELVIREDDKEHTILNRLKTYHNKTEPLIQYYKSQEKLVTVSGEGSPEETAEKVINILNKVGSRL